MLFAAPHNAARKFQAKHIIIMIIVDSSGNAKVLWGLFFLYFEVNSGLLSSGRLGC